MELEDFASCNRLILQSRDQGPAQITSQSPDDLPRGSRPRRRKRPKRRTEPHDEHDLRQAITVSAQPKGIDQSHAQRSQILSGFLELMFPDPKLKNVSSTLRLAFMRQIPNQDFSLPVLRHAIDALCFAGLGLIYNDQYLVQHSRNRYGVVLRLLGAEIIRTTRASNRNREQQRSVLTAIVLSIVCDFLDIEHVQATESSRAWLLHIKGAERYLQACGPGIVASDFDRLLFNNVRLFAFPRGIAQREATIFLEPQWLKVSQQCGKIALLDIGLNVAGLLERCEMLYALRHSLHEEQKYLIDGGEGLGLTGKLQQMISDVLGLRAECEQTLAAQRASMAEDKTLWQEPFPTTVRFQSVLSATSHTHLWGYMLLLDHALLRVAYFAPWAWPQERAEETKADAIKLASNITRSMPVFVAESSSLARIVGKYCNQIALAVFNLFGMEAEAEFCRSWDFGVDDLAPVHRVVGGFRVTERYTYWADVFGTGKIYGQGTPLKESSGCSTNDNEPTGPQSEISEPSSPTLAEVLRWHERRACSTSLVGDQSEQRDAAVHGWLSGVRASH